VGYSCLWPVVDGDGVINGNFDAKHTFEAAIDAPAYF
jgi:hypothetical protein